MGKKFRLIVWNAIFPPFISVVCSIMHCICFSYGINV